MPYEIPQNLKYVEKIAFGLTFWQLFWIALFGALTGIVFLKTNLYFPLKIILCIPLMGLGTGFAFFDFAEHAKTLKNYFFDVKHAGLFDKKLDNFIEAKKIGDNAIYLKNGSMRAVLEVTPINFSILSPVEQKAIITAYKDFLNSLNFPIQIAMRTTSLNLDDYLFNLRQKVLQKNDAELEKEFESFKEFVQKFIEENSVKNRLFYVVIPYSPYAKSNPFKDALTIAKNRFFGEKQKTSVEINKEIASNQLEIRVELCREKLHRCGLLARRLEDKELFALLASYFDSYIQAGNDYFFPITMLENFKEANA
ncbi:MAG: PrgI family protein [archaeon]|nr:PrgI family protein [archaeon]